MNTWTLYKDSLYHDHSIRFTPDYEASFYIWLDDLKDFGSADVDIIVYDTGGYEQAIINHRTITIKDRKKATIERLKAIAEEMKPDHLKERNQ